MKKQPLIILLSVVIVAALGYITYAIYQTNEERSSVNQSAQQKTSAEKAAIEAAKDYKPPKNQMCTTVMTPAIHEETGARYTFPSGCLPEGWKKDTSGGDIRQKESDDTKDAASDSRDQDGTASRSPEGSDAPASTSRDDGSRSSDSLTQDDVLAQARNYRPKGNCTTVMTPARHVATGTRYTFPTGCIPPGWVVERNSSGLRAAE